MADNPDDIVQNIKINVEDDGLSSFDKLKDAAQSAFDAIKQVFETGDFGTAFDNIKEASGKAFEAVKQGATQIGESFRSAKDVAGGAFSELGEIAAANAATIGRVGLAVAGVFTAIGAAILVVGKSFFNFTEGTTKAVNALGDLADKTHTSIQAVSELETAFAHAGVSANEFASGYSKLSQVVTSTWDKIKKETQSGASDLEEKSIAAEKAAQRLVEALRKSTGNEPTTNDRKVEEARAKDLALREAELANTKAQKAERDAQLNDIGRVTKGVQDLISGNEGALKTFNATADNIVQGVVAAAGKSSEALKGLGDGFASVGSRAPDVKDVLTTLGAALVQIKDPALQSEVALKALGKSGESFLSAFKSGNLDEFIQKVQSMGGAVNAADKEIAENFKNALLGLGQDLDNIKNKLGSAFGPGFTDILKQLDEFFTRNQDNIQRLGDLIASVLLPPLKLAATAFTAIGEAVNAAFDLVRNFVNLLTDIRNLKGLAIIEDFKNLYNILKAIAEILTGDVKKGLEDLAKERHRELEVDNAADKKKADDAKTKADAERTQRTATDQVAKTPATQDNRPESTLTQAEKMQRAFADAQKTQAEQQKKQDDQDKSLKDDFKKFQDTQPKNRFDGSALTPEQRDAIDFQKFNQRSTAEPPAALPQSSLGPGIENALGGPLDKLIGALSILPSILKDLSSVSQAKASESPEGLKPQTASPEELQRRPLDLQTPQAATEQSNLLEQLRSFFQLLTPSSLGSGGGKVNTDETGGIGIRGDAGGDGKTQVAQADQALATSAQQASTALDTVSTAGQQIASVGETATTTSTSLQSVGTAADSTVSPLQSLQAAAQSAAQALQSVQPSGSGQATTPVTAAEGGHIRGPGTETSDSIPALLSRNEFVHPAKAVRHYGLAFMESIRRLEFPRFAEGGLVASLFEHAPRFASGGPVSGGTAADGPSTQTAINKLAQAITTLKDTTQAAIDNLDGRISALESKDSEKNDESFSGGGHIRGPGSETSDSIRAWVSDNEFVHPAKATRHYGLAFMESIRTLQFPKFSVGGLVGLMSPQIPRFAAGGPVAVPVDSGGAAPHLGTVDLRTDHGTVRATVDKGGLRQLRRAAVSKNIGSHGKPGWVR